MKKKVLKVNILKDLNLPKLKSFYKKEFIRYAFDRENAIGYDLKSETILKKIQDWLSFQNHWIEIVGKGVYVEFHEDEIELSGN